MDEQINNEAEETRQIIESLEQLQKQRRKDLDEDDKKLAELKSQQIEVTEQLFERFGGKR